MNRICSILICVCISACLFACHNTKAQPERSQSIIEHDNDVKASIIRLLANNNIDKAIEQLDSFENRCNYDPMVPFLHGVALYMNGNVDESNLSFKRSIHLYDSLLAKSPSVFDAVNRSVCFLFTEGKDAFHLRLDSIQENPYFVPHEKVMTPFYELTIQDVINIIATSNPQRVK